MGYNRFSCSKEVRVQTYARGEGGRDYLQHSQTCSTNERSLEQGQPINLITQRAKRKQATKRRGRVGGKWSVSGLAREACGKERLLQIVMVITQAAIRREVQQQHASNSCNGTVVKCLQEARGGEGGGHGTGGGD